MVCLKGNIDSGWVSFLSLHVQVLFPLFTYGGLFSGELYSGGGLISVF